MDSPYARRPRVRGPSRRERRERERTAQRLRTFDALEAEVREQAEPPVGSAERPVGEAALRVWRRQRVEAHLALPPWVRAWRAWCAWGAVRRAGAVLVLAIAWTVVCLPLRAAGLATFETSSTGFAALAALAPLATAIPPWRRGRFARPPEPSGPPWRSSRRAGRLARVGIASAATALVAITVLAVRGPGVDQAGPGRLTAAHHLADHLVVDHVLSTACRRPIETEVRWLGGERYRAVLPGGAHAVVDVGRGAVEGPRPDCR
jgi:hypothetical protein